MGQALIQCVQCYTYCTQYLGRNTVYSNQRPEPKQEQPRRQPCQRRNGNGSNGNGKAMAVVGWFVPGPLPPVPLSNFITFEQGQVHAPPVLSKPCEAATSLQFLQYPVLTFPISNLATLLISGLPPRHTTQPRSTPTSSGVSSARPRLPLRTPWCCWLSLAPSTPDSHTPPETGSLIVLPVATCH